MGTNGRKLIEKKYTMDVVSKQMLQLYNWIKNRHIKKPNFINFDD